MKSFKPIWIILLTVLASLAVSTNVAAKKGGKPGGGGGTDTGHVAMEATGAGTGVGEFVVDAFQFCEERLAANDTSYLCNKSGAGHDIVLGDFLMTHPYPNGSGANCFGTGVFSVTIGVDLNDDNSAETVLRFGGFENDGVTDVLYVLIVNDPGGWTGAFPPAVGGITTMGVPDRQTSISWTLRTSKKSQRRRSCVASGTFAVGGTDFIRVDFTRID